MTLTPEQEAEIVALRAETRPTMRATVPALEEILYRPIPVLDHGFIRVIDYMGDDSAVVQAARVSYGKGTRKISEDRGLINYLLRHRHTTPFEMCEIKYHVKLPIFVARQGDRGLLLLLGAFLSFGLALAQPLDVLHTHAEAHRAHLDLGLAAIC